MSIGVTLKQIHECKIICHKTLDCEKPSQCIGNRCMAWCWVPKTEFAEYIGMEIPTDEKATHGYCGLIKDSP